MNTPSSRVQTRAPPVSEAMPCVLPGLKDKMREERDKMRDAAVEQAIFDGMEAALQLAGVRKLENNRACV